MAFMLVFIYFIVNQKIDVVGRMSEVLIFFFGAIVGFVFITTLSQIELKNIWPVTYFDALPVIKGAEPIFSLSCYITAIMFLGDKISDKKSLKKNGVWAMGGWSVFSVILILSTTGLFGHRLNAQLLFPYFATLKNIRILDAIERVESLFISIWVASDAIIITLFCLVALHLLKRMFNRKSHQKFSIWVLVIAFIIAVNFAPNAYAAEEIAKIYIGPINIILFGVVPVIALIIGKIRKVV
jgi:spore germination protein KB